MVALKLSVCIGEQKGARDDDAHTSRGTKRAMEWRSLQIVTRQKHE